MTKTDTQSSDRRLLGSLTVVHGDVPELTLSAIASLLIRYGRETIFTHAGRAATEEAQDLTTRHGMQALKTGIALRPSEAKRQAALRKAEEAAMEIWRADAYLYKNLAGNEVRKFARAIAEELI